VQLIPYFLAKADFSLNRRDMHAHAKRFEHASLTAVCAGKELSFAVPACTQEALALLDE